MGLVASGDGEADAGASHDGDDEGLPVAVEVVGEADGERGDECGDGVVAEDFGEDDGEE